MTEDGYQVSAYTFKGSEKTGYYPPGRPAVLMVPGILDDGARWLEMQTPDLTKKNPLPLMIQIANAGYEVWIGDVRGTEDNLVHRSLSPDDPEFWNFTWDDVARYDLPAMVDLVKKQTGKEKIFYIGYSNGATAMLQALADQELNQKLVGSLHKIIALSPCPFYQLNG